MNESNVIPPAAGARVVPDLSVPAEWAKVLEEWPVGPSLQLVGNIGRARDAGYLAELARLNPDFAAAVRESLAGPARSVTVSFPEPEWTPAVVSILGDMLGEVDYTGSATLGGAVREVPTGGVDRYEQAWHSDSVQWTVPNHWTILGLAVEDPEITDRSTGVLPWADIYDAWQDSAELLEDLSRHDIPWRILQPGLPPVAGPIRGAVPRWFWPLLAKVVEGDLHPATQAVLALEKAVNSMDRWYEAEVTPNRVLIFDNYGALHRGPRVLEPSARTILRLKVSGLPES